MGCTSSCMSRSKNKREDEDDAASSNRFNESLSLSNLQTLSNLPVPTNPPNSLNLFYHPHNLSIPNPYVTEDIVASILSHCSVQSLLRFQLIGNSVRTLIDSQKFAALHLHNSSSLNIIFRLDSSFYFSKFPTMQNHREILIPTHQPRFPEDLHSWLIGSCMGLTCLLNGKDIVFTNIITRRHKIVTFPNLDARSNEVFISIHGFGMVDQTCYKFVRIRCFYNMIENTASCEVALYTSNTDAWSNLPTIPYSLCAVPTRGALVNNHLHWMFSRVMIQYIPVLLGFDLINETFKEANMPEGLIERFFKKGVPKQAHMLEVSELLGCLCLILNDGVNTDIWLMKNYAAMEWNMIVRIPSSMLEVVSLRPVYFYGKSILFEVNTRKAMWYNMESKQFTYVEGIDEVNELQISIEALTHV